jgi:thymidine kinase
MSIRLVTGVMTSGKSERLIEEIDKCEGDYLILKPSQDTRDGAFVKTRAHDRTHQGIVIDEGNKLLVDLLMVGVEYYGTVFIDEVQFFSEEFVKNLIEECEFYGVNIIVSGLTRNFKGEFFPSMKLLWTRVERQNTEILFGECYNCESDDASVVVLMDKDNNILTTGETVQIEGTTKNHYENLCEKCLIDPYGVSR